MMMMMVMVMMVMVMVVMGVWMALGDAQLLWGGKMEYL